MGHAEIVSAMTNEMGLLQSVVHKFGSIHVMEDVLLHDSIVEYVVNGDPVREVVRVRAFTRLSKRIGEDTISR